MQQTVFYPKYTIRGSSDVLSLSLLSMIALLFSFWQSGPSLSNIVGVVFLLFFVLLVSRLYIRRIVFTPSYFLVERYIWPPSKINFSDVIDMGRSKVKTRKGEIGFPAMSNIAQLYSLFFELMRQGKMDVEQFENKALKEELVLDKTFLPAAIISAVLSGIFLFYSFSHPSRFSTLSTWLIPTLIAVVITSVVYWINKKRMKIQ